MAEVVRAGEGFSRLVGPQAQAVKLSGRWQNLCQHGLDPEADTPTSAKTLCSHPWPPPSRSPRVRVHQWPDSRAKPCRSAAGSPLRRGPQAGRCALCLTSCGLGAAGTEDHTQLSNDSFCVCLSAPLSSSPPGGSAGGGPGFRFLVLCAHWGDVTSSSSGGRDEVIRLYTPQPALCRRC